MSNISISSYCIYYCYLGFSSRLLVVYLQLFEWFIHNGSHGLSITLLVLCLQSCWYCMHNISRCVSITLLVVYRYTQNLWYIQYIHGVSKVLLILYPQDLAYQQCTLWWVSYASGGVFTTFCSCIHKASMCGTAMLVLGVCTMLTEVTSTMFPIVYLQGIRWYIHTSSGLRYSTMLLMVYPLGFLSFSHHASDGVSNRLPDVYPQASRYSIHNASWDVSARLHVLHLAVCFQGCIATLPDMYPQCYHIMLLDIKQTQDIQTLSLSKEQPSTGKNQL